MRTARAARSARSSASASSRRGARWSTQVAEDVEVLAVVVERRELDGGDHAEAASRARLQRLVDAVHRVMVGQRQQLDARVGRGRHHGAWR